MLSLLFLAAVALAFRTHTVERTPLVGSGTPTEYDLWFDEQIVDHFDPTNQATWSQRYYVNSTHYAPGGPLLIYICGEAECTPKYVGDTYSTDYFAQKLGGVKIALEHRFYGLSFPGEDAQDIRLLSSRQALADLARFIPWVKARLGMEDAKVVVIGGSYPGDLAAWARLQFPFVVDAAISSSGPLMAKEDFQEYLQHVAAMVTQEGSMACMNAISAAIQEAEVLLETPEGKEALKQVFNMSKDIPGEGVYGEKYEHAQFIEMLVDEVAGVVQYAVPDGFEGPDSQGDINKMCSEILKSPTPSSDSRAPVRPALMDFAEWFRNRVGDVDSYYLTFGEFVEALSDPRASNPRSSSRSWLWQTCTEFGWYQTATEGNFGALVDLDYSHELCYRIFFEPNEISREEAVETVADGVRDSNVWYGARNVPRDSIFYANGEVDPWSRMSMLQEYEEGGWAHGQYRPEGTESLLIPHGSHCTDLRMSWTQNEAVREQQLAFLRRVLGME